jgi:Tfp pilus assembly protein PilV
MPTSPVPCNARCVRRPTEGFTFVEVSVALLIACITITVTASTCLQVLRLSQSGRHMLAASLALQREACRYHINRFVSPPPDDPAATSITTEWNMDDERWAICTLTSDDQFVSITSCLALRK